MFSKSRKSAIVEDGAFGGKVVCIDGRVESCRRRMRDGLFLRLLCCRSLEGL